MALPSGLASALVDVARPVTREATGVKIEGSTRYEQVRGPRFRCRLAIGGQSPEGAEPGGRPRVRIGPQLLFETRDLDGFPLVLHADDEVEVESNQQPLEIWRVNGEPLVIRTKVELLGAAVVDVVRIAEP